VIGQYPKYLYLIGLFLRNKKNAVNEKAVFIVGTLQHVHFSLSLCNLQILRLPPVKMFCFDRWLFQNVVYRLPITVRLAGALMSTN
jgi:hypothetical protein